MRLHWPVWFLGLIFWVTFCSNRNTLTFDSNSYKKTNLSGVKIVVIVSPLPLVDAHTKICPKYWKSTFVEANNDLFTKKSPKHICSTQWHHSFMNGWGPPWKSMQWPLAVLPVTCHMPTQQILTCDPNSQWSLHAFFMEDSAIHKTVMSLCWTCVFWRQIGLFIRVWVKC